MIKLYIAQSLDGYIAGTDDSLAFLDDMDPEPGEDYGYEAFIKDIQTIYMGRKTYEALLQMDVPWPYPNHHCHVVSNKVGLPLVDENITIGKLPTAENLPALGSPHIHAWVCGGGQLIRWFLENNAIDHLEISTTPVLLGAGTRLFPEGTYHHRLRLVDVQTFKKGMVHARYKRR